MESSEQSQKQARRKVWLDSLIVIVLFVAGLGIRWLYAEAVTFPPLDDPAFYLKTADNLVSGRGLVVDAMWSYHILFPSVTHPSHEHWMPLPTGLIAAAFALGETALRTGQWPGLILGALLAPLTYLFGRRALPQDSRVRWVALGAGLLVAFGATLSYQSASADSSAVFALLAAWALTLAVRRPDEQGGYFAAGLLIALAYLARTDGLLLLVAVPLAWWLLPEPPRVAAVVPTDPRARAAWELWLRESDTEEVRPRGAGPSWVNLLDLGVAFAIVVAAWLVRNYLAFGTPWPTSALSQAWLTDYIDTFNYWHHPTWQDLLAQGWQAILIQRGEALLHNAGVFLLVTFPWGLLALPGFWLLRKKWAFFPALIYGLLLFFGMAIIFPVSTMSGTFYHSIGALVPFLALAAVYAIYRGVERLGGRYNLARPLYVAIIVGLLVLVGAQTIMARSTVGERHQAEKAQFEAIAGWLAQHAAPGEVVMTTQPYTLNYVSGHPSIVLPGNEPPDSALEAAQRYGARFLIITESFGQYPQILHDQPDSRFRLLEASDVTEIYEIVPGASP